jgi:glycosyltransferase involved in cell wall biosynthesis
MTSIPRHKHPVKHLEIGEEKAPQDLRVSISVIGKFHLFDLATELHKHGVLEKIFTAYPRFKLTHEQVPRTMVDSFPWFHTPYMSLRYFPNIGSRVVDLISALDRNSFEGHVAKNIGCPDIYVGLSGTGLRAGRRVKETGGKYVCDRGSTHIEAQNQLLVEEHSLWGQPYQEIPKAIIAQEKAEYDSADMITVPSTFAERTFIDFGIPASKIAVIPYGVEISKFFAPSSRSPDGIDILFVGSFSLRKGVPYLLQAFKDLKASRKSLTFVGDISHTLREEMYRRGLLSEDIRWLGHVPQIQLKNIMSKSHTLVLPSIEDGFGLVQAQAMASGCVVISSENTGGRDLFTDGTEGYVVPIRSSNAIRERFECILDSRLQYEQVSYAAIERVRKLGGWSSYGKAAVKLYRELSTK